MTDKDRDNFVEVLLALNGYRDEDENESKDKLPVKWPVETANPLNYYGYTT